MANDFQIYPKGHLYVDSDIAAENVSIKVEWVTNLKEVTTLVKDIAGFTPGAKMIKVTLGNVFSGSGTEIDIWEFMDKNIIVNVTIWVGNSKLSSKGCFMTAGLDTSTTSETKTDCSFLGTWAKFE